MARTIKTSRQDIYIRLVENAESNRDGDEGTEEPDDGEYPFQYQYELFSLGALIGFHQAEQIDSPDSFSQDIRRVEEMNSDNEHRQAIDIVNKLVQIDHGANDIDDVWDDVLRYADAGVEYLNEEIDVQDDFDLVRIVREAGPDSWRPRFKDTVGSPEDVETLYN